DSRLMLSVTVAAPAGPIRVYSTHTSGDACQVQHIGRAAQERRGAVPSVLMGDFNASEDFPALTPLKTALLDAFRAANPDEPGFTDLQQTTTCSWCPTRAASDPCLPVAWS